MEDQQRRVLIVTSGRARGSLSAVREFGRAGWTVGVGTPDGSGMVAASRWGHLQHRIARPRGSHDRFLADLDAVLSEHDYDIVFGGSDDYLAALTTYRDRIPTVVGHPTAAAVMLGLDKLALAEHGEAAGITSPSTRLATDDVIAQWMGPVVVKCRSHWFPGQTNVYRIESSRFDDVAAAADRIRTIRDAGFEPVLQALVDGRLGAVSGVFRDGRLVGRVQHEAERVWPTPSGVSCRAITVEIDTGLIRRCEQMLDRLGWEGIVELQFLTDQDGHRHLIDLNGRFYGSMALAIASGVSLPILAARQALGEPDDDAPEARAGTRFSWIAGDLRRATVERRGGLIRDTASSLRWARGATTSVWDTRDLRPVRHLAISRLSALFHTDSPTD